MAMELLLIDNRRLRDWARPSPVVTKQFVLHDHMTGRESHESIEVRRRFLAFGVLLLG